jgi:hypothetical protein
MNTLNKILLICFSILTLSCEDILEKDISKDIVQIISPTKDVAIESNVVNFKWISLKGANKYRIQIYESNQVLILDSLTTKSSLTLPLNTGNYIWKVRAENYAYQSTYSFPSAFSTTISDDLTNQQVILVAPDNDKYFNVINVTLNWKMLDKATSYSAKVINTVTKEELFSKSNLTDNYVVLGLTTLADGTYEWRINAKNAVTETKNYTARRFNIDTKSPNQPKNTMPTDNSTQMVNKPINYAWSIDTDTGTVKSPISYIIEFSNNVNFNPLTQTLYSNTLTLQQTFSNTGVYYWRVRAIDAAGNIGTNSTSFKITVN